MEKEEWKVFNDTRSNNPKNTRGALWKVSDQGRVKKNGVLYECKLDKGGYKVFGPNWAVHRAVAMLFIPNPNKYNEIDHINGDPLDNRAINLKWCTHKQNCNNPITIKRYKEANKGKNKGENHPMYGKTQSEESNRKNSETHKGKKLGPQSEEHKRKRSESMKLYWVSKKLNN